MKQSSGLKKVLLFFGIGACLEFLVVLLTGIFVMTPLVQGFKTAVKDYGAVWALRNYTRTGFVSYMLIGFDFFLLIVNFIVIFKNKKPIYLLGALALFLAIAFLPFLFMLSFARIDAGTMHRKASLIIGALIVLNLIAIAILSKPLASLQLEHRVEGPTAQPNTQAKGLSELEVRAICEDYIELHEEEKHQPEQVVAPVEEPAEEPVEEPVPEEPVEEEPVEEEEPEEDDEDEEEEEEEEVEVVDENGQTIKIKRKKRVSFENRLRRSEYDIRHKYYDLRDYIKWYGLNNRISIPGDSFSYKRRKYAFITIVGKHIKFYIALDPDKYENSPIPVERATAKKYIDTPCVLRIKSDLSYRRAKLLVDDLMKQIGMERPEGDEPKETQHPEAK